MVFIRAIKRIKYEEDIENRRCRHTAFSSLCQLFQTRRGDKSTNKYSGV